MDTNILKKAVKRGQYNLITEFNLRNKPKTLKQQFSIIYYLLSPNQQLIAIFVQSSDINSSYQPDEILLEIRNLMTNNKQDIEDCWMDGTFDVRSQITLFSPDSKYLVLISYFKNNFFIFDIMSGKTKLEYTSIQKLLSIDDQNNLFYLEQEENLIMYSITSQNKKRINIGYRIDMFFKISSNLACSITQTQLNVIHQQNFQNYLRFSNIDKCIHKVIALNYHLIIQMVQTIVLKSLRNGKILRQIDIQNSSIKNVSKENSTAFFFKNNSFQMMMRRGSIQEKMIKREINQFIRFDILRGVTNLLYFDVDQIRERATVTTKVYIDLDSNKQCLRYNFKPYEYQI